MGNLKEAKTKFKKAIIINPNFARSISRVG